MNDCAFPAVILANTAGHIIRICYKMIHSLRSGIVPVSNIVRGNPEDRSSQGRHAAMICGMSVPEVTHRRVAVANVRRMWISEDSFHGSAIGRNDQVIAAQV